MLKDLGPPICNITWRPENIRVTVWNLLLHLVDSLSGPNLKTVYTSTFPDTLKFLKNHEISVYFSTNAILALCHAPQGSEIQNSLVSKRMTLYTELKSCKKVLI